MATTQSEVLTALEVDAQTGETIERELNAEEIAEREEMKAQAQARQAEAQAKEAARASALGKLADLGLTAEEIAAL
jgi:hypothetical protein